MAEGIALHNCAAVRGIASFSERVSTDRMDGLGGVVGRVEKGLLLFKWGGVGVLVQIL